MHWKKKIERVDYTKIFKKDWEKLKKSGKGNLERAKELMQDIASGERPLPLKWKDHELAGALKGQRDAHFGGDWLIIYRETEKSIIFERIGTHNQLFD